MRNRIALLLAVVLLLVAVVPAFAETGYESKFATAITYQNVTSSPAHVVFSFYNEKDGNAVTVERDLPANAGSSLSLSGLNGLPTEFMGSAVLSSDQTIVATLVQIPQPTTSTVRNRPLSNGFATGASQVLLATVLKNQFNTTSKFSIQNASDAKVEINLKL